MTTPIVPAMKPSASEREAIARIIDPTAWSTSNDPDEYGFSVMNKLREISLRKADTIAAGFRRDPGWIACRPMMMPPKHRIVLVFIPGNDGNWSIRTLSHDGERWWHLEEWAHQPTHWQPLPPAPDDNDKAREGMA